MSKENENLNYTENLESNIVDTSDGDIDYKQLYYELYENVAKMLVENRKHD